MAWIEVHQSLPTHRKTLALADALNIEPVHAVGHLTCLWLWALDNAPDGNLANVSIRTLARAAQWRKEPQTFMDALVVAGLMDADKGIHDWPDYAGRLIERRRKDADRKRSERGQPPEVPPPSNGHLQDGVQTSDASRARVNRTVPNRTLAPSIPHGGKARARTEITDLDRGELVEKWRDRYGGESSVREEIDCALNHVARYKAMNERLYVDGWLRRELQHRPVALRSANGRTEPVRRIIDRTGMAN